MVFLLELIWSLASTWLPVRNSLRKTNALLHVGGYFGLFPQNQKKRDASAACIASANGMRQRVQFHRQALYLWRIVRKYPSKTPLYLRLPCTPVTRPEMSASLPLSTTHISLNVYSDLAEYVTHRTCFSTLHDVSLSLSVHCTLVSSTVPVVPPYSLWSSSSLLTSIMPSNMALVRRLRLLLFMCPNFRTS